MGIEGIQESDIRLDDYIDDINANAASPLENSPYFENLEEVGTGLIDGTEGSTGSPSGVLPRFDDIEDIQDISGNYIINEGEEAEPIQLDPLAYTDGTEESDAISNATENIQQAIEDTEFELEHNGLNPQEWEELMDWLRDNGLGWLADYLEENPEDLPYILELLLDPDAYWGRLEEEAGAEMEDDADFMNRIIEEWGLTNAGTYMQGDGNFGDSVWTDGHGNYYVFGNDGNGPVVYKVSIDGDEYTITGVAYSPFQEAVLEKHADLMRKLGLPTDWDPASGPGFGVSGELLDTIAEQLGLTYENVNWIYDEDGNLIGEGRIYRDEEGNLYAIFVDEDGVHVVEVESYLPPGCNVYNYQVSGEETVYGLDELGLSEAEVRALSLSNLGEDDEAFLRGVQDSMWISQDGDYIYISEEMLEYMQRLQKLYNVLSCLFLLVAALNEIKRVAIEILHEFKVGQGEMDLLENAQTRKDNAMMKMRYQFYSLKKYVDATNNRIKQEKINEARDEAYNNARNIGTYICEVISWGGADVIDRKNNEFEQKRIAEIEEEYEAFQRRVEERYEEFMDNLNFDTGDPFGAQIDDLMGSISADELLEDVGDGYLDVNNSNPRDPQSIAGELGYSYVNTYTVYDQDGNEIGQYDVFTDGHGNEYIITVEGDNVTVSGVYDPLAGSDSSYAVTYELTGESRNIPLADVTPLTITNPEGTGLRDRLVALENLRKVWAMLQLAKSKINQAVVEATTEVEFNNNPDSLIITTLNDINQFEQQIFSEAINKIIGIRDAHNAALYAREQQDYWHDMATASFVATFFGPLSYLAGQIADQHAETWRNWNDLSDGNKVGTILGLFLLGMPITDCSVNGPPTNFHLSDLKIDVEALEKLIQEAGEAQTEAGRQIIQSEQVAARALEQLERKQWLIIGQLDGEDIYESDENGIWTLNEAAINDLRSQLVACQNIQRAIFMLQRARNRLNKTVSKIVSGKSAKIAEQIDTESVDSIGKNKLLAFELKLQNLKNRVQQHNKIRLDKLRRIQLLCKSLGMTAGVAVAVILIVAGVFSGGTTLAATIVAAIGIISALGSLGSAIGNMIYHGIYGQDENLGSSGNFYDDEEAALYNYLAADVFSKLEKEAQEQIDRIRGTSESYNDVGVTGMFTDGQWALDPALFLDVNNELLRIQTMQKVVMMLEQAKQDIKNVVAATTTGSSSQGESDFVKSSVQAVNKVESQAITLKKEMVQDIISAHNRKMAADEDFYRSIVSAAISAASSVCAGVGSAGFQGVSIAADVLSACSTAWNLATAIFDNSVDNEVMNQARQDEVNAIIDKIYQQKRKTQDAHLRRAEREAIEAMHDSNLVVGIGGGRIAVDVAAYYALRHEVEKIYNVYEAMAKLVQASSKNVKTVAQKTGIATAADNNAVQETINTAKDTAFRNLEILNIHLQNYVDRNNQIQEASKALTMAIVNALIQALQMVMKYCKVNVNGERVSIRDALNDWVRGAFQDEGSLNVLGDLGGSSRVVIGHLLGNNWDGRISVGDLVNLAIEVLMSPELARLVATAIYNAVVENEGEGEERGQSVVSRATATKGTTASSFVDFYDAKAFEEEINLADAELQGQKDEIIRLLSNELRKNLINLGKKAKDTLGSIRQPAEGGNVLIRATAEEEEEAVRAQEAAEEQVEEQQVSATATVVVPAPAATVVRHPEQELRARFQAEVTDAVDPETRRVAEQTAAAVVAQLHQPDSRPRTTVRVESTPEVRTTTTTRVEQPSRASETLPAFQTAQRILQRARAANQASQQLNGDQVVQELSAMKAELIRITIQLPGSTNPEVAQTLRRVRESLRRDLTPEEFEQVTREVAEAARALGQTEVADELQRAVSELQEVVRNNETMTIISERVEALVQGMERGNSSPTELVGQILASGISDRVKAEIFEQALVQIQERDAGAAVECYRVIPPSIRERLSARTRTTLDRLLSEESGQTSWLESLSDDAVVASAGASFFQEESDDDDDTEDLQDLVWGNAARRMEELSSRIDTGSVA
jgi:hypothetical protein